MNAQAQVLVKAVHEKISQSGTKYYQVDMDQTTDVKMANGQNYVRQWRQIYYPHTEGMENPSMLVGYSVPVTMTFYPIERKVGDKVYHELKCSILKFN